MGVFIFLARIFRSAFRNRKLTFINILGLGVGLGVVMFLLVYLQFEFSFDKSFKDADRIYRMLTIWEEGETERYPLCLDGLAPKLMDEVPEVEKAARLYRYGRQYVSWEQQQSAEVEIYEVDPAFLRIFNFGSVAGQPETALDIPGYCVITRRIAERVFGKEVDPLGKVLADTYGRFRYKVAAVLENIPENTHFNFDMLIRKSDEPFEGGLEFFTYVKFREGVDRTEATRKCNAVNKKLLYGNFKDYSSARFDSEIEPLTALHIATRSDFDLSPTANKINLLFITLIAIFILAIAVSNFISLFIIQGEGRALEFSICKTHGAIRRDLIIKLFSESLGVTLLAFLLAFGLYNVFFGMLSGRLSFNLPADIGLTWTMIGAFSILFVCVALAVGIYPAIYLSRFQPMELIRKSEVRKYRLTVASVIVQFSVVVFCIAALLVVRRQLNYIQDMPLGFQPENVLEIGVATKTSDFQALRSELQQYPGILQVGVGETDPISSGSGQVLRRSDQQSNEAISVNEHRVGPGYFEVFGIPIVSGRVFSDVQEEEEFNIVINESLVAALRLEHPVGQKVNIWEDAPSFTVIGVVKDVIQSAHNKPGNWIYTAYRDKFSVLAVKFAAGKYTEVNDAVRKVLRKYAKDTPARTFLLTDRVCGEYSQDEVTYRILTSGMVLAVVLALLGLLALSGFVARQKRKEISIRRVMGAQISEIVYTLNGYILLRILPAIPLGIVTGYYVMHQWLQNFVYAVPLNIWDFVMAIGVTLSIVLLAVMYQILAAARANPVEALKGE